jgi:hypothetical protein
MDRLTASEKATLRRCATASANAVLMSQALGYEAQKRVYEAAQGLTREGLTYAHGAKASIEAVEYFWKIYHSVR